MEADEFDAKTPLGSKPMKNLVFTHDPSAPRRFVLAAHLDSKYFPTHPADQFVGATDSAAPCAMLLDLATALTPWLDERKKRVEELGGEEGREGQGETLQIVFFDGEEAFVDWTAEDSIYGAKHLAEKWSVTDTSPAPIQSTPKSPLRRISHFVLLDLLGAPNPLMRSFFPNTGWLFDEFLHSEERLGQAGLLWPGFEGNAYTERKGKIGVPERSFFVPRNAAGMQMHAGSIEDDHLPFMKAGVPIVHLIAVPFPSVWHTIRVSTLECEGHLATAPLIRGCSFADRRTTQRRSTCPPSRHGRSSSDSLLPNISDLTRPFRRRTRTRSGNGIEANWYGPRFPLPRNCSTDADRRLYRCGSSRARIKIRYLDLAGRPALGAVATFVVLFHSSESALSSLIPPRALRSDAGGMQWWRAKRKL